MKEFEFYLDAYKFCLKYEIPKEFIMRKNWKTWTVEIV
jgi:hypothetical protein